MPATTGPVVKLFKFMEVLHNKVMEVYGSITQERRKLLAENMLPDQMKM